MKYDKNLKCNVIKRNFVKRKIIPKKRIATVVSKVCKDVNQITNEEIK